MNDRDLQIERLEQIMNTASMSPVFRGNRKYKMDGVPRIAYDDVMSRKCIIRCDKSFPNSSGFWTDKDAPVVVEYRSIEELVDDGWVLD